MKQVIRDMEIKTRISCANYVVPPLCVCPFRNLGSFLAAKQHVDFFWVALYRDCVSSMNPEIDGGVEN